MVNILVGFTGSVATIKCSELLHELKRISEVELNVVLTEKSRHFFSTDPLPSSNIKIFTDEDEWTSWEKRGDPVLHIELAKWADIFLIAPLGANSLAKIANGLCDNLLTCVARAWNPRKPLIFCPAMNTQMYEHIITQEHINKLLSWGYKCIPVIEKTLMCGDTGLGAMAEVSSIVEFIRKEVEKILLLV